MVGDVLVRLFIMMGLPIAWYCWSVLPFATCVLMLGYVSIVYVSFQCDFTITVFQLLDNKLNGVQFKVFGFIERWEIAQGND